MKNSPETERDVFSIFIHHHGLRRMRIHFDSLLGHPAWWAVRRPSNGLPASPETPWPDPRIRPQALASHLRRLARRKGRIHRPFWTHDAAGRRCLIIPLTAEGRPIGMLGLSGVSKKARPETMSSIHACVELLVENCTKTEQLDRLSASIRPRAIALSTVHTVHRIINSTLNLDELVVRLTRLTAQVLRVMRCRIFLLEKPEEPAPSPALAQPRKTPPRTRAWLIEKGSVGYPKNRRLPARLPVGRGLEGRVAKTAKFILRRRVLSAPLIDEDVIGVITVAEKKDKQALTYFDREILTTLAEEAVIAIKNAQLYEEQRRVTLSTIQSLAVILGMRLPHPASPELFLKMVLRLAQELKLSEEETLALHYATLLKDTAKVGIPEAILKKTSKLTGEEYQLLKTHPVQGAKIVQSFENLKPVAPIILYSREKFDGTGYPEGLKGERIPVGARILAVVNAFEAILFGRPYRDQASLTEALEEIRRNSGTQFDPRVVDAFLRIVEKEGFARLLKKPHPLSVAL